MIENVSPELVESIILLFENKNKTGGDICKEHKYIDDCKTLIIFYENEKVARNVINHEAVKFSNKTYKAQVLSDDLKRILNRKLCLIHFHININKDSKVFLIFFQRVKER